jgi:CheY-like chemotaxis protein
MNGHITFDLTNSTGFLYITDTKGVILEVNKELSNFLCMSPSEIKGKKLNECTLLDGYMLDQNNICIISEQCPYREVHEVFTIEKGYNSQLMISHKRLIFLGDRCAGLFNQSIPVDAVGQYNPTNVFNISNVQLGLKIKENMNALYAFKSHLNVKYDLEHQSYMDSMMLILDKMRMTMDGIILSNDRYNNAQDKLDSVVYDRLYIGDSQCNLQTSIFATECHSLDVLLGDKELQNKIVNCSFAVIYLEIQAYRHLQSQDFAYILGSCNFNTLVIVIDKQARFEGDIIYDTSAILNEPDMVVYDMWRNHIKKTIRKNIISSKNMFVLSIEDDPDSQDALCSLLERYSTIKVTKCSTGVEALDEISKQHYDLIILDINLGDISGFEIAREIRFAQKKYGFINSLLYVNTGYDYTEKVNAKLLGIDAIYLKPYLIMDIDNIINDLMPLT